MENVYFNRAYANRAETIVRAFADQALWPKGMSLQQVDTNPRAESNIRHHRSAPGAGCNAKVILVIAVS